MSDLESRALAKTWFYRYTLPSGAQTPTYDGGALDLIHETRTRMLDALLSTEFGDQRNALSAVDLACHQGWFSVHLAQSGFARVLGVDARSEHIDDSRLIRDTLALSNLDLVQSDVHALDTAALGHHDLVLCFGLIYHLENPVGALRVARALCKRVCVVETQVVPGQTGWVDYGSYRFVRPLKGSFGIIDETGETHGPEASTTGICLVPSLEALIWIMQRIGFKRVEVLPVPEDGYEQLVHHKRVMVAGWVE
ncbi:MAG: bifunctional 3-demethylubiquinone-9 3-methyltransferase/ 2-octaprenyl-6-hydroxy phenol methylase [Alphaproteobacteria bacterium ADurb.BinA280]|jgi:tRNA (mo5U34)-methyltransferase|nr:class I SAM-dependent methyltransferase [Aquimonas sp.]OPZ13264.1 MAG: bifunctional 3-demethylubiquinone-9 3-methyltransferase/ 2-octaprenyl-6-hydroxy phenol methylase [Alphaproteobacteria bacterium ADurb.BinA280]